MNLVETERMLKIIQIVVLKGRYPDDGVEFPVIYGLGDDGNLYIRNTDQHAWQLA